MTSNSACGRSAPFSFSADGDNIFDNLFNKKGLNSAFTLPRRRSRSAFRNKNKLEDHHRPSFGNSFEQRFAPDVDSCKENNAQDILNKLKSQLRKEADMFLHSKPDWNSDMFPRKAEDGDDWAQRGFEDMRSRHPMFRMPNWMSEDDDVSNLASRMSHSPHFSSIGRRGNPWRERPGSGGSGFDEDGVDGPNIDRGFLNTNSPNAVRIPIRIEAEAPPGCMPVQPQEQEQHQPQKQEQQQEPQTTDGPQPPMNQLHKQPQFASKTTSSIDTIDKDNSRNTRCSSAPPDMKDPSQGQRFVSNASIFPQVVSEKTINSNQDFNNVAKPFVPSYHTPSTEPIAEENLSSLPQEQNRQNNIQNQIPQQGNQEEKQFPNQNYQQQYQYPQQTFQQDPYWENSEQKPGVVRNIPIIIEGRNERVSSNKDNIASSRSPPQMQQPTRPSHWDHPMEDPHFGFGPSPGFPSQDNFFNFSDMPQQQPSYSYEQPSQQTQNDFHQPQKVFTQQPSYQTSQQEGSQNQFKQREKTPEPPKDVKMETIASVRASVNEFQDRVEKFDSNEKNKEFLYIDEMLTRALLQLDNIDPDGREDVRQARKNLIKDINSTISKLEKKVSQASNEKKSDLSQEVDNKSQEADMLSIENSSQNVNNSTNATEMSTALNSEEVKDASMEQSTNDNAPKTEPSSTVEENVGAPSDLVKVEAESLNKLQDIASTTDEKCAEVTAECSQPQT